MAHNNALLRGSCSTAGRTCRVLLLSSLDFSLAVYASQGLFQMVCDGGTLAPLGIRYTHTSHTYRLYTQ
mgnify:CR=1 FL=1